MKQPDVQSRLDYADIVENIPVEVQIPRTRRKVKISGMKPYTLERLTRLWLSRDMTVADDSSDTLKGLTQDPYFNVKQAVLMVLNGYWKIRLFYPVMWRIWGKWHGYTEDQMTPIIAEGKKKLPLMAYWTNMVYSVDMRTDWKKMTRKEAEQYRAELLSAANQHS